MYKVNVITNLKTSAATSPAQGLDVLIYVEEFRPYCFITHCSLRNFRWIHLRVYV